MIRRKQTSGGDVDVEINPVRDKTEGRYEYRGRREGATAVIKPRRPTKTKIPVRISVFV